MRDGISGKTRSPPRGHRPAGRLGRDRPRSRRTLEAALEQAGRLGGRLAAERVGVGEQEAVREDGLDEPLDVARLDVIASTEQRHRAGAALERQRAANRRAGAHARELARRAHEVDHPALQQRVDVDVLDGVLERPQVVDPDDGREPVERMPVPLRLDDSSSSSGCG